MKKHIAVLCWWGGAGVSLAALLSMHGFVLWVATLQDWQRWSINATFISGSILSFAMLFNMLLCASNSEEDAFKGRLADLWRFGAVPFNVLTFIYMLAIMAGK